MLICFGDISDYIGRRTTMLLGLAASFLGVMLFAVAPDLLWIYIGRAFMGVGVGLSTGPATAAMIEFSAAGQAGKASAITTVAQSAGLALATLIGGALIRIRPLAHPTEFLAAAGGHRADIYRRLVFTPAYQRRGQGPVATENPRHPP